MNFIKKPRRHPLQLQLTAMIDIFSMIVIFLVLGTVISGADVQLPTDFMLPRSSSKEMAANAPKLLITSDKVEFLSLNMTFPIALFSIVTPENAAALTDLKQKLQAFTARSPASTPGRMLNIVADERLPYNKLYDVLSVFKEAGFETLLFVTVSQKGGT